MVIFDLVLWIPAASDLILSDKYLHQNKVSQGLKPKTCGRRALQQRLPMFVNLLSNCWNKLSWNPTPRISHGDKNNLQSLCMALLALMLLNKAPLVWLQSGHIRLSYYASGGPGKWWQGHHDRDIEWNWIGFISYLLQVVELSWTPKWYPKLLACNIFERYHGRGCCHTGKTKPTLCATMDRTPSGICTIAELACYCGRECDYWNLGKQCACSHSGKNKTRFTGNHIIYLLYIMIYHIQSIPRDGNHVICIEFWCTTLKFTTDVFVCCIVNMMDAASLCKFGAFVGSESRSRCIPPAIISTTHIMYKLNQQRYSA